MSNSHSERNSFSIAFIAILFWSTVATAFKLTLNYTDPFTLLAFSSLFSFIVLFLALIVKKQVLLLFKQSMKDWYFSIILGLLNPFLYYLILFNAYSILHAQEAMVLNYSWPLVISIFSAVFLKNKIKANGYIAIMISFLGIIIIATKGNLLSMQFESPLGIVLALSSAIVWASFWILNLIDKREPILKLSSGFLFGTVFSFIFLFIKSPDFHLNTYALLGTIYIGTFEMGLTFILWLTALSLTKKTEKVSQLVYISPFLSLIFISIILKETLLISSVIGLVFIISGIIIQNKIK